MLDMKTYSPTEYSPSEINSAMAAAEADFRVIEAKVDKITKTRAAMENLELSGPAVKICEVVLHDAWEERRRLANIVTALNLLRYQAAKRQAQSAT